MHKKGLGFSHNWAALEDVPNCQDLFCAFLVYFPCIFSPTLSFILQIFFIVFSIHNAINYFAFFCIQFHKSRHVSTPTLLLEEKCGELGTFSKPRKVHHDNFFNITTCLTSFNRIIGKAQPFVLLPRTPVLEKVSRRKSLKESIVRDKWGRIVNIFQEEEKFFS